MLRLSLAAALLIPLGVLGGESLVSGWLPAYRAVFGQVAGEFRILSLELDREGADRVVRARVGLRPILLVGGKLLYPDARSIAQASTQAANALLGPLLAFFVALAWPARRRREFAVRMALLPMFLAPLVLLDAPCVLAAELWQIVLEHAAPGAFSPLVAWKDFLQGGGRYALGLAAGAAGVVLAARFGRAA